MTDRNDLNAARARIEKALPKTPYAITYFLDEKLTATWRVHIYMNYRPLIGTDSTFLDDAVGAAIDKATSDPQATKCKPIPECSIFRSIPPTSFDVTFNGYTATMVSDGQGGYTEKNLSSD